MLASLPVPGHQYRRMGPLFDQLLGAETSLWGRILALLVIAAVVIFAVMARTSVDTRRDSPEARREEADRERRAELIARAARRELAERE